MNSRQMIKQKGQANSGRSPDIKNPELVGAWQSFQLELNLSATEPAEQA